MHVSALGGISPTFYIRGAFEGRRWIPVPARADPPPSIATAAVAGDAAAAGTGNSSLNDVPGAHGNQRAVGLQLTDELLEECERTDNVEPIERAFKSELSSVDTEPFLRPGSWASAEAVGG